MSGILDSKSRIIDAILTIEGRRKMAEGSFNVSYVTFTDAGVSYIPDEENGHVDPGSKFYFEACNLPQDQITFEADDSGNLVALRNQDIKVYKSGSIFQGAQGTFINGKLSSYSVHTGGVIKASPIQETPSDNNKGFIYSDSTGLTGSILIKPTLVAGSYQFTPPSPGSPFVAYLGTRGGMGATQFVQVMSGAIEAIRSAGGPIVYTVANAGTLYLNYKQDSTNSKLYTTGSLSSPLQLQEPALGGRLVSDEIEAASLASQIQSILTSSFDNFSELQTISTVNNFFEDDKFTLSQNDIEFNVLNIKSSKLNVLKQAPPRLNSIDSIFSDQKLSHLDNFLYLPPIIKTSDALVPDKKNIENLRPYLLGDYPSWGNNESKLNFEKIQEEMKDYESQTLYFDETSLENRIIGQFFEVSGGRAKKLDVVDFGEIRDSSQELTLATKRIYFVGKTFIDDRGTTCFVNMFTLVFSRDERAESEDIFQ